VSVPEDQTSRSRLHATSRDNDYANDRNTLGEMRALRTHSGKRIEYLGNAIQYKVSITTAAGVSSVVISADQAFSWVLVASGINASWTKILNELQSRQISRPDRDVW